MKLLLALAVALSAASHQPKVLSGVLESVAKTKKAVVVFDLDDTLLDTAGRHARILQEFARLPETKADFPLEVPKLAAAQPAQMRWDIVDTLKGLGVEDKKLEARLKSFWAERFFANNYLPSDLGALQGKEFVEAVLQKGGTVVYCTGRNESLRPGTELSLATVGYPAPDGKKVQLWMKADKKLKDDEFKQLEFPKIAKLGAVVAAFDNEPRLINIAKRHFPGAKIVFLDTKHSGAPVKPEPGITWVKDFALP